jgi:ferric-dicitrate binding protein FerR (iron transport regulator)
MKDDEEDDEDEHALREDQRARALSPEALQHIRRTTEAEWRAIVARGRRRWVPVAAVASVALLAMAASWILVTRGTDNLHGAPFANVARVEVPGIVELRTLWRDEPLRVGSEIRGGQKIAALGATLLELRAGGNLRLAPGSDLEVTSANSVRLVRGEMYVDVPAGLIDKLVAVTDAGEFRHVDTQFALASTERTTRLRVRKGNVQWRSAGGQVNAAAGTEFIIERMQIVSRATIDEADASWLWADAIAPQMQTLQDRR